MNEDQSTFSGLPTTGGNGLGPGTVLGHYELREPLGRGGMGQVWKAWDRPGAREVALKLLPPEFRGNPEAIALVQQSFQQVHALTHTSIGKTLAMLEDPLHGPYIVMDLVPGITLSAFAARSRQEGREIGVKQVVKLLRPIAAALDYAHSRGVLHRDVKPPNILVQLSPFFQVTLIDFGLAAAIRTSLTQHTGRTVDTRGTRPYMSPEQFRGKSREWDGRTDQYALAIVAYELLAGHTPFEGDDEFVLMYAVINEPADPIRGQSEMVNAALLKALAKNRGDRFPTCAEFIDALEDVRGESGPAAKILQSQLSAEPAPKKPQRSEPSSRVEALTPQRAEVLHNLLEKLAQHQQEPRRSLFTEVFQGLYSFISVLILVVACLAMMGNLSSQDQRMMLILTMLVLFSNAVYWTGRSIWKQGEKRKRQARISELIDKIEAGYPEVRHRWGGSAILEEPDMVLRILNGWPESCGLTSSSPGGRGVQPPSTAYRAGATLRQSLGWLSGSTGWLIGIGVGLLLLLMLAGAVIYSIVTA